ncbi:MAG: UDP-N-acetylglucosamine--N-acetylmuramyl-(pentapeptide) pyrophosphoryl-undecaprenol N-acetylglucosamine transferase [Clostridia bacterium]
MNIALTGGGTAGHIMPNIALVAPLKKHFDNILYIGNERKQEADLCAQYNLQFVHCDSIKFDRTKLFSNAKIPFAMPAFVRQAKKILLEHHIDIVFSKGGYVSLPVVLAAKSLHLPVICHESDLSLGLANKLTATFARKVITSHPETPLRKNYVFVGNPLREQIFDAHPEKIFHTHNFSARLPIILVVGGSLGATVINSVIYNMLDELCKNYFVIHICGKNIQRINHSNYLQLEYAQNIQDYIAVATLVISRCGANFSQEISALNKKAIYIPLPATSSRGDQIENATLLQQHNFAQMLLQENLSPITLLSTIERAMSANKNFYYYDRSIPDKIVNIILDELK